MIQWKSVNSQVFKEQVWIDGKGKNTSNNQDRESDDVAQRRAAAAEAWMLEAVTDRVDRKFFEAWRRFCDFKTRIRFGMKWFCVFFSICHLLFSFCYSNSIFHSSNSWSLRVVVFFGWDSPTDVSCLPAQAGIPAARFTVSWEVGGPSLCRRTDFRLLDKQGSDALMKRKAEDVMKRIFSAHLQREETPEVEEMRVQEKPDPDGPDVKRNSQHPDVKTLPPKLPEPQGVAPEPVNTAEVDAVTGSGDCGSPPNVKLEVSGQQVCLVFTKVGRVVEDFIKVHWRRGSRSLDDLVLYFMQVCWRWFKVVHYMFAVMIYCDRMG